MMTPTLIVLVLVILAAVAVVWVVRRGPARRPAPGQDKDTAWNDPVTPAARRAPLDPDARP